MANKTLNAVITIGGTVTSALKGALGSTRTKLQQIGSAVRDLEKEQRRLQGSIRDGMNMGRPVEQLHRDYRALQERIAAARREQDRMNGAVRGMDRGKSMMGSGGMMIGAAAAAAATAFVPVAQAAAFEKSMLGVAKQVQGARDGNGQLTQTYYDMARQIQQLGREVPIATNEIADMVAAGARMGVARDQLIGFTRTAAMMASAFDLPAGELADQMGKIAGLFQIPIPKIGDLADAINYLDDNAISKGQDIIDFLTRTGGVAGSVKVTGKEMAALGSTLLTLGERTETAGTATNALFQKLAAADKGTKKFRSAMAEIGLSTTAVQKGMQVDAQGTILKVLDAVNKLPKDQRIGVMVDLVGLEHSDTIAKLAGNIGEYRKQIDLVNSQQAKGSMGREFSATLATTTAQWEITKNTLVEIGVNIGSVLLPPLNALMGVVRSGASAVADFAREHPTLTRNIMAVSGALVGSLAAFGAVKLGVGAVVFAFNALRLAVMTNPIGLILTGVAVGASLIIANWAPISAFFGNLWGGIKSAAETVWTWLKASFLTFTPLGVIVANWAPLSSFFGGLFGSIKATVGAAIDWVLNKISAVGSAWQATKQFFGFGGDAAAPKPGAPATGRGAPPAPPGPRPGARTPPPLPPMATGRGGRQAAGVTDNSKHTFHITQQPGQDSKALADDVIRKLDDRNRTRAGSALYDGPRGY